MENNTSENIIINENQLKESTLSPLFRVTLFSKLLAGFLFVTLPFVGFYIGYKIQIDNQKNSSDIYLPSEVSSSESISVSTSTQTKILHYDEKDQPVLIYSEQTSFIHGEGRSFPVLDIYKKVGDNPPTKITTIGANNEYAAGFAVSPDKKLLVINLESKLVVIDLSSGDEILSYTPESKIGSNIAFSPDSKQIAYVDGDLYDTNVTSRTLNTIDVDTKNVTILYNDTEQKFSDVLAWRTDNNLLLHLAIGKGCTTGNEYSFNVATKTLTLLPYDTWGLWTKDNIYLAKYSSTTSPVACSNYGEMCGYDLKTTFDVIDPVTNKKLGFFGDVNSVSTPIAFSSDGKSILYKSKQLPKTENECAYSYVDSADIETTVYSVKDLSTNTVKIITDVQQVLKDWHAHTVYAYINYKDSSYGINIGEKTLVTSSETQKHIIDQYYGE